MVKVLLTGPLDKISKHLVELLVKGGNSVSIITESGSRRNDIEEIGAVPLVGSVDDSSFLATACADADVVCIKVPTEQSEAQQDEFYHRATESVLHSVRAKKIILLSGVRSHIRRGKGIVLCSLHVDQLGAENPSRCNRRPHLLKTIKNKMREASGSSDSDNEEHGRRSLSSLRPHLVRQVLGTRDERSSLKSRRPHLVRHLIQSIKGMIHPQSPTEFDPSDIGRPDDLVQYKNIAEAIAEEVQASAPVDANVCYIGDDSPADIKWVSVDDVQVVESIAQS